MIVDLLKAANVKKRQAPPPPVVRASDDPWTARLPEDVRAVSVNTIDGRKTRCLVRYSWQKVKITIAATLQQIFPAFRSETGFLKLCLPMHCF